MCSLWLYKKMPALRSALPNPIVFIRATWRKMWTQQPLFHLLFCPVFVESSPPVLLWAELKKNQHVDLWSCDCNNDALTVNPRFTHNKLGVCLCVCGGADKHLSESLCVSFSGCVRVFVLDHFKTSSMKNCTCACIDWHFSFQSPCILCGQTACATFLILFISSKLSFLWSELSCLSSRET